MKEINIFNNHFYLHKTGAIFWKEKDILKKQGFEVFGATESP